MQIVGTNAGQVIQLIAGAIAGVGLAVYFGRHNISIFNPATRGKAFGILSAVAAIFIIGSELFSGLGR